MWAVGMPQWQKRTDTPQETREMKKTGHPKVTCWKGVALNIIGASARGRRGKRSTHLNPGRYVAVHEDQRQSLRQGAINI